MEIEGAPLTVAQAVAAASVGLLYYDHLLTFSREVEWVWLGSYKLSFATILFFANRYISFFGYIPLIYEFFSFRNDEARIPICIALRSFREAAMLVTQSIVAFFFIARTYALWNKKCIVLVFLIAVAAAVIIYTIVMYATTHKQFYEDVPNLVAPYSCLFRISDDRSYKMLSAWIGVLIFDTLVFAFSIYKVIHFARKERPPILWLLLRDGIVYFAAVAAGCLMVVLTFWPNVIVRSEVYSRGGAEVILNTLSSTLASRLFLNLRDPTLNGSPQARFPGDARFAFYRPRDRGVGGGGASPGIAERLGFVAPAGGTERQDVTMTVQLQTLDYIDSEYGHSGSSMRIEEDELRTNHNLRRS